MQIFNFSIYVSSVCFNSCKLVAAIQVGICNFTNNKVLKNEQIYDEPGTRTSLFILETKV